MNRMIDALALSYVPRWSIVIHSPEQYVGDHTFRTLVIFKRLCDEFGFEPTVKDIYSVLYHDLSESRTGDIPKTAKKTLEITSDPIDFSSGSILHMFHLADLIEAHTFIQRFGAGEHARKVTALTRQEIQDYCPAKWWSTVTAIIDEIVFDDGR